MSADFQMIRLLFLVLISQASPECTFCPEGYHGRLYADYVKGDGTFANCGDMWARVSRPRQRSFAESCKGRISGTCWESCAAFHRESMRIGCCEQTRGDKCWIQTGFDPVPNLLTDRSVRKLSSHIADSGCAEVMADFLIFSNEVTSLKGLEALVYVGRLRITNTKNMTNLQGLDGLKTVGELTVLDNLKLTSLRGLSALTFACTLIVVNNVLLSSMLFLDGLQSLGSCVRNQPFPKISNSSTPILSPMAVPKKWKFALALERNNAMTSLHGLDALVQVGGSIHIANNKQLRSFSGLDALVNITAGDDPKAVTSNVIEITNNPMLTSLRGLQSLKIIQFNIVINSNDALMSIQALDSIENHDTLLSVSIMDNALLCLSTEQKRLWKAVQRYQHIQNCSCVPGRFPDGNVCTSCPAGSFCIGGQARAQPCPAGSHSTGGGTPCKCTKGFEPDGLSPDSTIINQSCRKCREFSTSAGDNGQCFCDSTAHGVEDYFGNGSMCSCPQHSFMNKFLQRCQQCNEGEECDWHLAHLRCGASLDPPSIKPGYWAEMVMDESVFPGHSLWRCYSAATCLGNSTCAAHRTGIACGDCLNGFYGGPDGPCSECGRSPATHRALLACIMGGITLATFFLLQVVSINRWRAAKMHISPKSSKRHEWTKGFKSVGRAVKQVIKYFQILGVIYTFHIEWPAGVRDILEFFMKFSLSIDGVLREHCLTDHQSVELFVYYKCALPVVVLCMLMASVPLAHALAPAMRRAPCTYFRQLARHAPMMASDACQLAFQVFSVFFISIQRAVGSAFRCRDNPNGRWVVQEFPQMECFVDRWMELLPVLVASVLFYVMCYVIGLICVVRQCSQSLQASKGESRGKFGFIVEDFRTTQIAFPVVVVIKDVAVNAVSLLPADPGIQLVLAFTVLALYVFAVVKESPFEDPMSNHFETVLHVCLIVQTTFIGSMGFFNERIKNTESLFIALFFTSLVPIAAMLILQVILAIPCLALQVPEMFKPLSKEHWQEDLTQVFEAMHYDAYAWKKLLCELDPVDRARASRMLSWNVQLNADGFLRPRGSRILLSPWEWPIHNVASVHRDDDRELKRAPSPSLSESVPIRTPTGETGGTVVSVLGDDDQEIKTASLLSSSESAPIRIPTGEAGGTVHTMTWGDVLNNVDPNIGDRMEESSMTKDVTRMAL